MATDSQTQQLKIDWIKNDEMEKVGNAIGCVLFGATLQLFYSAVQYR